MGLLKETAHNYYSGNDLGNYQFTSLDHVINNFMIGYVGDGKIIPKVMMFCFMPSAHYKNLVTTR